MEESPNLKKKILYYINVIGWPITFMIQAADFINLIDDSDLNWKIKWHKLLQEWFDTVDYLMNCLISWPIEWAFHVTIPLWLRSCIFFFVIVGSFFYRFLMSLPSGDQNGKTASSMLILSLFWPVIFPLGIYFGLVSGKNDLKESGSTLFFCGLFFLPLITVVLMVMCFAVINRAFLSNNEVVGLVAGITLFAIVSLAFWWSFKYLIWLDKSTD